LSRQAPDEAEFTVTKDSAARLATVAEDSSAESTEPSSDQKDSPSRSARVAGESSSESATPAAKSAVEGSYSREGDSEIDAESDGGNWNEVDAGKDVDAETVYAADGNDNADSNVVIPASNSMTDETGGSGGSSGSDSFADSRSTSHVQEGGEMGKMVQRRYGERDMNLPSPPGPAITSIRHRCEPFYINRIPATYSTN
jgi:hypothetical protein